MTDDKRQIPPGFRESRMVDADAGKAAPAGPGKPPAGEPLPKEVGGPPGPEPTRYGDWAFKGRVTDF